MGNFTVRLFGSPEVVADDQIQLPLAGILAKVCLRIDRLNLMRVNFLISRSNSDTHHANQQMKMVLEERIVRG